jgi:hypothetical protein
MSPGRDRKSETTTREKWPQKWPFCLRANNFEFRKTACSEIRMKNRLARTLLETYVGSHAGELILAGATRRGSGTTVRAAPLPR